MQKKRTKKKLRFAGAPAQTESNRIDASRKIILEKKERKKKPPVMVHADPKGKTEPR